jgi:hypothetical protein
MAVHNGIMAFLLIAGIGAAYFAPAIVANRRKRPNAGAIFAVNLLLGWTVLGWVLSLVWALTTPTVTVQLVPAPATMPPPG